MRTSALLAAAILSLGASGCVTTAPDHNRRNTAQAPAMQLGVDARALVQWADARPGRNYVQRQTTAIAVGGGQTLVLQFPGLPAEVFNPAALGDEMLDLTVTVLTTVLDTGGVHHAVTLETVGTETGRFEIVAQPSLTVAEGETATVHIGTDAPGQLEAGFTLDLVASRIG
ncbi:hypothetical protein [Maricaulis sp.]|uniref:hypothetical protein n=1 Tax=Maricaulis sp. TaxID=1486257 RepID=UPI003A8F56B7